MITRIVIPQAFENMEEATIGAWLKSEGDQIVPGDPLCELITEKTTFPLPAEGSGILRHIAAAERSIVPVGTVIGVIGAAEDELPDIGAENAHLRERLAASHEEPKPLRVTSVAPVATTSTQAAVSSPGGGSRVRATPAARRAARDRGIDIEQIAKAYPGKVLSEEDVKSFEL